MSNHKQVLTAAKNQANAELASKRIAVRDAKTELEDLGVADDYEFNLKAILRHYGKPLSLGFISEVLPDSALLLKVRKLLRKATEKRAQEIEEYKDGEDQTRTMIKLLPAAKPAAAKEEAAVPPATEAPSGAKEEAAAGSVVEAPGGANAEVPVATATQPTAA